MSQARPTMPGSVSKNVDFGVLHPQGKRERSTVPRIALLRQRRMTPCCNVTPAYSSVITQSRGAVSARNTFWLSAFPPSEVQDAYDANPAVHTAKLPLLGCASASRYPNLASSCR